MKLLKALIIGSGLAMLLPASAQTINFNLIGSFDGTNGAQTRVGLVEGTNGNFYGVGYTGGSNDLGTVFELAPGGPVTSLYGFSGGSSSAYPYSPLLLGQDGNLYGEMLGGGAAGYGYIFQVSPAGVLTTFASFDGFNGYSPFGGLMQGQDGNFYGTCQQTGGNGSIFQITPDGTISNLFSFAGTTNGSEPYAGLVQGTNGVLYGTTYFGGTNGNYGTIFQITTDGVFTNLFSFNKTNGVGPSATLVFGPDGNLYGTTRSGGTNAFNNSGTIFRITPAGQFTSLVSFGGNTPGVSPYGGLVLGTNGLLYGMTSGGGDDYGGTIFQMDTNGTLITLYSFPYDDSYIYFDGNAPEATLVQGTDGNFYGTTSSGGDYNKGTVFSFSLTPPVVSAPVFQSVSQLDGMVIFTWSAVSNANYQVQYNTDLSSANWLNLGGSVTATNTIVSTSDSMTNSQCFYRVLLLQ